MQTWIKANIGKLIERFGGASLKLISADDYEALEVKDPDTLYIVEDTEADTVELYLGDNQIDDSGFIPTEAQLTAMNSGITAEKVANYDDIYAVLPGNPLNHNSIYRGRNLSNVYTWDEIYERVHNGTFADLYIGDYKSVTITTDIMTRFTGEAFESGVDYYEMGGGTDVTARTWTLTEDTEPQNDKIYATKHTETETVNLMIAAFNYYYNMGDTSLSTPHIILIPRGIGFMNTAKMNSTNTTVGGYLNSDMHQIVLPCYAKSIKTALNNHLLSYRTFLSNAINASTPSMAGAGLVGASSGEAWTATELQLMNEPQLYGTRAWTSSAYDIGIDYAKMPVFNFVTPETFGRGNAWLRSVVSSAAFALCNASGIANFNGASAEHYVHPIIVFG